MNICWPYHRRGRRRQGGHAARTRGRVYGAATGAGHAAAVRHYTRPLTVPAHPGPADGASARKSAAIGLPEAHFP